MRARPRTKSAGGFKKKRSVAPKKKNVWRASVKQLPNARPRKRRAASPRKARVARPRTMRAVDWISPRNGRRQQLRAQVRALGLESLGQDQLAVRRQDQPAVRRHGQAAAAPSPAVARRALACRPVG